MVFQPLAGHQKNAWYSPSSKSTHRQIDVVDHASFIHSPAVQTVNAVEVVQVLLGKPTFVFADFIKGFVQYTEVLFKNEYKQTFVAANNRLIRWRKADLIFPFHYYW